MLYLKSTWYIFTLLNSSQVTRVKKKTPFLSSGPFYSRPHLTRNQTQSDSDEEDDGSYSRHPQLRGRSGTQVPMAKRVRVLPVALSRTSTNTNSFLKFSCGKCSLRFAWPDDLEKHIRTAHNSRMSIRPTRPINKRQSNKWFLDQKSICNLPCRYLPIALTARV